MTSWSASAAAVPGGVQISLGDAYGDERRRIVFQLHVPRLETLEENLTWMSDERYRSASKKAMLYQMRSSRERRRKGES